MQPTLLNTNATICIKPLQVGTGGLLEKTCNGLVKYKRLELFFTIFRVTWPNFFLMESSQSNLLCLKTLKSKTLSTKGVRNILCVMNYKIM